MKDGKYSVMIVEDQQMPKTLFSHYIESSNLFYLQNAIENAFYGEGFTRNNNSDINKYLNYGYTLVLSQFSKAIVAKGYLTQLGIHHIGETNYFNLACDFMEPVRPFIDKRVKDLTNENFKEKLVEVLSETFVYDDQKQTLSNAISLYVSSLLNALALQDPSKINFIKEYE